MTDEEPQLAMSLWDLDAIKFREDGEMIGHSCVVIFRWLALGLAQ